MGVCQKVCGVFCEERRVNWLDIKRCTRLTKATFTWHFPLKRKSFLLCFVKKKALRSHGEGVKTMHAEGNILSQ